MSSDRVCERDSAHRVERLGEPTAEVPAIEAHTRWADSGCAQLTGRELGTPIGLVGRVCAIVERLDDAGAGLADTLGHGGLGALAERAAMMGLPPAGRTSAGGATHLVRAGDGWLAVSLARDDDRALVPAWLEIDADCDPWEQLEEAVGDRSRGELLDRATLLGLPVAGVDEPGDDRAVIAERLAAAPPKPLEGALVVNLSALWAGPLCADVLARLGARVLTVESTRRPDGGRLARGLFEALHGRSESVALDLTSESGRRRLVDLIARAEIVIEGSRPRALAQMGIAPAAIIAAGGPHVWVSITAHGRSGRHGDRVGFGDDAAAAGGLVGWIDGAPRFVADAVADPLTGLTAALAVVELLASGGRWHADIALARTARSVDPDWHPTPARAVRRPQARADPGARLPLGRDTDCVLAEFGID